MKTEFASPYSYLTYPYKATNYSFGYEYEYGGYTWYALDPDMKAATMSLEPLL